MAFLGIDTSNYTSSVAVSDGGRVVVDNRKLLEVRAGALGLRQSETLYQHWSNLPVLLEDAMQYDIEGIAVSSRPRARDGSYMPVFSAGLNTAKMLSAALRVPLYEFSHQDGHILAASYMNDIDFSRPLVCAHLSGGTLELIRLSNGKTELIGGTRDISYGQLIDRLGVLLGLSFPAGKEIDALALRAKTENIASPFSAIHIEGCELNISGIETQMRDYIRKTPLDKECGRETLAYFIMKAVADSFIKIVKNSGADQVLVTGGVASSGFLRNCCEGLGYSFGAAKYCSDNAAGLALSEGVLPWQ